MAAGIVAGQFTSRGQQGRTCEKGVHAFYSGSTMLRCLVWHCRPGSSAAARNGQGMEWMGGRSFIPEGRREVRERPNGCCRVVGYIRCVKVSTVTSEKNGQK
ncbi:hypothetical protein QR685DRAFT_452745 [Neurospora intermedia]|uniref:Uncharacterized protein n=1 Tax=Neurospora intermedia TaxID=5142 RepID=A0ABR3CZI8_NEUIN